MNGIRPYYTAAMVSVNGKGYASREAAASLFVTSATFAALERAAAALGWLPGRLISLAVIPVAFFALPLAAGEGMWMPQQIPQIAAELQQKGIKIDPNRLADLTGDRFEAGLRRAFQSEVIIRARQTGLAVRADTGAAARAADLVVNQHPQ